jgi:uncharacterized protein YegP (UPF0339 family)
MNAEQARPVTRTEGPWRGGATEREFLRREGHGYASTDADRASPTDEIDPDSDIECRFEVFRADERAMTSTLFSGGDWRWRLVTTDGLILAEAAGYRTEGTCRAAVAVLQRRAATAAVVSGTIDLP